MTRTEQLLAEGRRTDCGFVFPRAHSAEEQALVMAYIMAHLDEFAPLRLS